MRRAIALGLLAALGVFLLAVALKTPRHDREWKPHLAQTPVLRASGDGLTVHPLRDWTYDSEGPVGQSWQIAGQIETTAPARVWLVVEPHPGIEMMAHTLVLFEFEDGDLIGLTIEARKEADEDYSPLRGAFNRFELVYMWATPRDLLTRRAIMHGHELEIYPLDLTGPQRAEFLEAVLARTDEITQRPRFYNTLTSNCTNELAKAAGLSWDPAFILTGGAAQALYKRGVIQGESFADAQARADAEGWVRSHASERHAQFNAGLIAQFAR